MNSKLILSLVGMPGAGKSVVVRIARESGYGVVVMGDEVREEARRRNMEPTPENLAEIMLELRRSEGKSVMAKRCIPKMEKMIEHKVIVDGVRSLSEVEEFRKRFLKFSFIAIHASPEKRFRRLYHRKRSDDPKSWEAFQERDMRELSVGLGNVIAMAEHVIVNEEGIEVVKRRVKEVLARVEEKWTK